MNTILSGLELCFMDFITYPPILIEANKMTFIQGESGCGKSTLFRLLNLSLSPSCGTILFEGTDITTLNSISYRRQVLLASQELYLPEGNIRDSFHFFYEMRDEKPLEDDVINSFLSICCLPFPLTTSCATLSGGERQRVFLAICLSFSPKVLLLDEPTSALDSETASRLLSTLKEYCLSHRITPVIICHDKNLTEKYVDSVITLKKENPYERNC